jgi:hypothetical protein
MKYESPQLMALMPAINAVQSTYPTTKSDITMVQDALNPPELNDTVGSYADWED